MTLGRTWLVMRSAGTDSPCFDIISNLMSSVTGKTVSFNVHGVMYVEDDGRFSDWFEETNCS